VSLTLTCTIIKLGTRDRQTDRQDRYIAALLTAPDHIDGDINNLPRLFQVTHSNHEIPTGLEKYGNELNVYLPGFAFLVLAQRGSPGQKPEEP